QLDGAAALGLEALGGDEDFLAALAKDAGQVLLGAPIAREDRLPRAAGRRVDIGHAQVDGPIDEGDRLLLIAHLADGDGAETEDRHAHVGAAKHALRQPRLRLARPRRERIAEQHGGAGGAGAEKIATSESLVGHGPSWLKPACRFALGYR